MEISVFNGKKSIKNVWEEVKKSIETSLPFAHEDNLIVEDIYTLLCNGRHDLWVFKDQEKIQGFIISEVFNDSQGDPCLHIILMGAESTDFVDQIYEDVKNHLITCDIKKIQFSSSRAGMNRFTNKFNCKEKYVVYEGTLNESEN